jgi:hypothetical protein
MNIASDGGDEASTAAETGETARTVPIALITKMGEVSAGPQLNVATFRLNLLRCSLELFEGMRADWWPLAVFTRISAAMVKICPFMLGEQSTTPLQSQLGASSDFVRLRLRSAGHCLRTAASICRLCVPGADLMTVGGACQ